MKDIKPEKLIQLTNRLANEFYGNLEKAINESGRIPIEEVITVFGESKIVNMGYITIKVEPKRKLYLIVNNNV